MVGITFGLFTISILLIFGGVNYYLSSQRGGVYPPRKVLQQKAFVIFGAGVGTLLLAIIALWIT
ncbi:hypothetical protein [Sutcliffiella deserti]|uniref:hypothetical protein n=1 Tax=Sutcliffiella deserti TaxID=2875501 RepID=UPI001CBAF5A1|nr:hypothetical protein [Sutcliffiella deserti]